MTYVETNDMASQMIVLTLVLQRKKKIQKGRGGGK